MSPDPKKHLTQLHPVGQKIQILNWPAGVTTVVLLYHDFALAHLQILRKNEERYATNLQPNAPYTCFNMLEPLRI